MDTSSRGGYEVNARVCTFSSTAYKRPLRCAVVSGKSTERRPSGRLFSARVFVLSVNVDFLPKR